MKSTFASFEPLRERSFRFLFFARTTSFVGDSIVPVAVAFAVLRHGDATDLGIVLAIGTAVSVVFLLAGGVVADRLPRQLVMMGADGLRAIVQALLAAAFFANAVDLWQIAVGVALLRVGSSFFNPASTGFIASVVKVERLQGANALLSLSTSAINIAGPALSGVLIATVGFGPVFAIDAFSFAASFVCLAAIRIPRSADRGPRTSMLSDAREGLRAVRNQRWIVAALAADAVLNFVFAAYFVLGPVVVKNHFDGARDWGFIMAAGSVGTLIASALVLRVKPHKPLRWAYICGFVFPLQLLAFAVPLPLTAILAGSAIFFAEFVVLNTFWVTMVQQHVPGGLISRVDSLVWAVSTVVMPIGMVIVGPVSGVIGIDTTLVVAAGLAAASLIGALLVRDVRDLPRLDRELAVDAADRFAVPHES